MYSHKLKRKWHWSSSFLYSIDTDWKQASVDDTVKHDFSIEKIAAYDEGDRQRLLLDPGVIRNRLKINAAIVNAQKILELKKEYGSFKSWLDTNRGLAKDDWIRLFKKTFKFTGGEIVNEFLMSTGYLPGAHDGDCPVYKSIVVKFSHELHWLALKIFVLIRGRRAV